MVRLFGSRGFTRIEVLVVVLVGMLLLVMFPPVSRRARSDAARETCRAKLAQIGKAMLIYANDYEGKLPQAGGRNSIWGGVFRWDAFNRQGAFGLAVDGSGGQASISSCFYLLVKYAELRPADCVCPADTGTAEFRLSDLQNLPSGFELIDAWDFGPEAARHCSYAYHLPFGLFVLSLSSDPGMAVAADRNPWLYDRPGASERFRSFRPDLPGFAGTPETARQGNSVVHGQDGQNVLFVDGHVSFAERSYCGLDQDNIYTTSGLPTGSHPQGVQPNPTAIPQSRKDSFLVHDPPISRSIVTHRVEPVDSRSLKQTAVVATLDCPLPEQKNVIWCSTFQMAWDKFKMDLIGEPIQILGAESLADRLNRAAFPSADIDENSYYANAGFVKNGIIEQIRKDMAQRFPAELVPAFGDRYRQLPEVALAYAYLSVDVAFEYPYYSYGGTFDFVDSNGVHTGITAFCAQSAVRGENHQNIRDQVEVLHYEYGETPAAEEFIVDLCKHTQPYQVILARLPRCATMGEMARMVREKTAKFKTDHDYDVLHELRPIDTLAAPNVLYKLTHHFEEFLGKSFGNESWRDHFIFEAVQKIDFTLSRTGVVLKSEARMGATSGRPREQLAKPRHLRFDRPFLICVKKREPDATPFFLMWVDNAELMQAVSRGP